MRMTDLVIGEHYAWKGKRVKLLATGVVLKNYQHKGVQIEVLGHAASFLRTVPTRDLTSTWDDFTLARAKWEIKELERHDAQRKATNAKDRIIDALRRLKLSWGISASAYPDYIMLTINGPEAANALADALIHSVELKEH